MGARIRWVGLVAVVLVVGATGGGLAEHVDNNGRVDQVRRVATRTVQLAKTDAAKTVAADEASTAAARAEVQQEQQAASAALSKAQDDAKAITDKAAADAASTEQSLADQKAALDDRDKAISAAELRLHASQFSDGLFEVGKDIQAGKYHTDGATGCYWAKLHSSSTNDIADNDNAGGPVTLVVDTPFFDTHGCGTWTKVS